MNRALLCLSLAALAGCARGVTRESVSRVVDGDTLVLASGEWVRLLGIAAPERRKPGGPEATEALRKLVAGEIVEVRREGRDRYGRTLARLRVGGLDISAELLLLGLAEPWPKARPSPKEIPE